LRAQRDWAARQPLERAEALRAFAARVRELAPELCRIDAEDCGIPIRTMEAEVRTGASYLDYFAGLVLELKGQTIPATVGNLHYTVREPFGVVGRIIPYNHPVMFACEKIAAPLAAGNAVVLKPAEQTPLSALRLAALALEVLPPGLVSVLTGDGQTTGAAIVAHPAIQRLAFTGGVATGQEVLRASAASLKEVSLELGGKNPMIVFPDAAVDAAAEAAVTGMNFQISAGQSCGSNSRILVHRDLYEPFLERFLARVRAIRLGPAVDPQTEMGPLITDTHRDRVCGYIRSATEEGARLLSGGSVPQDRAGYFVEPTVFDRVSPGMRIAEEEIFGPVVTLFAWDHVDEMLQLANGVRYGLTANIWTNDLRQGHRVAAALEVGYVWVNGNGRHYVGTPFGGYKASGIGREESIDELFSYTRVKTVNVILE
ncbi:MAG TPA: aldehyde dehydrogenase family protein, partial [Actinomycetes bacterium]|nr:aldehyde dehydrogenase family protein [Actinomycetes bacterium]